MSRAIQRSVLTAAVLNVLTATGTPIGDAEQPRGGTAGWIGQPNADGSNFVAYSVLTPGMATSGQPGSGPVVEPGADAWFPYVLTSFGVSRAQCEDQADLTRLALVMLNKVTVTMWSGTAQEYGRRIQTVIVSNYGPLQRLGDADPRTYGQSDTLSLWTTG